MSNPNLFITDERMLKLMAYALNEGLAETESEYLGKIGFPRTNIRNVRVGVQGFTKEHIFRACELTGASADYIFGFSNVMKRKPSKSSIDILKEAVIAVEIELKKTSKKKG